MAKPPTFAPQPKRDPSPVFWKCVRCKVWVEAGEDANGNERVLKADKGFYDGQRLCRACYEQEFAA